MSVPPFNILHTSLDQHIAAEHPRLVKDTALISVHAKPITSTPENAVGYAMKSIEKLRFGGDDIEILPKAWSEMKPKPAKTRPASPRGLSYPGVDIAVFSGDVNG